MGNQHFVGDIVKKVYFDQDTYVEQSLIKVLNIWLIEEIGHKIDILDIAHLQYLLKQNGITLQLELKQQKDPQ